jgi:thioester reductase-like protein
MARSDGSPLLLITGATGLVGRATLRRLLDTQPNLRALALVRTREGGEALRHSFGELAARVTPVLGDVRRPGLGLDATLRRELSGCVTHALHSAGDICFSRALEQARAVNTAGTAHALELATDLNPSCRFAFVSTAYVAGRAVGVLPEEAAGGTVGFVNAYEQSKHEAETLVRASGCDFVILRPSSIICDAETGAVTQVNAVHRALWLYFSGLVPMLPGDEQSPLDVVPSDWVARAVAQLTLDPAVSGRTFQLCAGRRAPSLGALFDLTDALLHEDADFRRRGVCRPAVVDLPTYRLFEQSVHELGDVQLVRVVRGLSHFIEHMALPKTFGTEGADAVLGEPAPSVLDYWPRMISHLLATHWAVARTLSEAA